MATITLSEEDELNLRMILVDRDAEAALAFLRERLLPLVNAQQGKMMISHLDGGKGSIL
jgi:hypothetical protein